MPSTVTQRQEARALALARAVLEEKRLQARDPGLVARAQINPEKNLVGFLLLVPVDQHKQVASQPAVHIKQATRESLGEAFDEGMRVIRESIQEESK